MKLFIFLALILTIFAAAVQITAGMRENRAEQDYPPEGTLLEVDGARVHAVVMGQPQGTAPDVVLIHGAGGNVRDFTFDFAQRLADDYRVIIFDRPGLGWTRLQRSDRPGAWSREGTSPQRQAALLQMAADQLEVQNPIVLGHSFGGAVALAWAVSDPDTAALVMLAGVAQPWPGALGPFYTVLGSVPGGALIVPVITAFTPRDYVRDRIDSIFAPQSAPEGYDDHVGASLSMRRGTLRANVRQVNTLRPHIVDLQPAIADLTLPIEIVHGDADTTVPLQVHSEPLAALVDSAVLTVLPGIGHMPHHSDPQAAVDAIDRAAARAGLR